MPVRLEPSTPRYRVKHSTTEPLHSLNQLHVGIIVDQTKQCLFNDQQLSHPTVGLMLINTSDTIQYDQFQRLKCGPDFDQIFNDIPMTLKKLLP